MNHSLSDRCILIVEDEYLLATQLKRDLRKAGAMVLGPVPSVDLALHLVDTAWTIHAAVLDVNLSGETCYPVADALVERGVPFLFATGYADNHLSARYRHVPQCGKPFEFAKLESAILSVLSAPPRRASSPP